MNTAVCAVLSELAIENQFSVYKERVTRGFRRDYVSINDFPLSFSIFVYTLVLTPKNTIQINQVFCFR